MWTISSPPVVFQSIYHIRWARSSKPLPSLLSAWWAVVMWYHRIQFLPFLLPLQLFARTSSSKLWLKRQRRDPFVRNARINSYRCRSAFKLLQINDLVPGGLIRPGDIVVDCGAAPGSWTQVAVKLSFAATSTAGGSASSFTHSRPRGTVISLDLQQFEPVDGAVCLGGIDIRKTAEVAALIQRHVCLSRGTATFGGVDVVLSDIAPIASGLPDLDHPALIALAESVLKLSLHVSRPGASLLLKLWNCDEVKDFVKLLERFYPGSSHEHTKRRQNYACRILKPPASRSDSAELYLFARGLSFADRENY
uniref:rRNA methyltransferase 2, mitochondrial n=1 Tax=Schistocephalus solidus TaxID=70667 RepID=A0A0V0J5U5_SCHSO